MSRMERYRSRRIMRRRIAVCIIGCMLLFYFGLNVVDAGTRELLGTSQEGALLKFSARDGEIIQVDIAGEKILINKQKVKQFIKVFQEKLGRVKKEVIFSE